MNAKMDELRSRHSCAPYSYVKDLPPDPDEETDQAAAAENKKYAHEELSILAHGSRLCSSSTSTR